MSNNKVTFFIFITFIGLLGITLLISQVYFNSQKEVAAVKTQVSPTKLLPSKSPTISPSIIIKPTAMPKVVKRIAPKLSPIFSSKQKGGWYWNGVLKKSQVWLGTDGEGRDIWVDSFPEPTATPTPYQTYSGGSSNTTTNSTVPGTVIQSRSSTTKINR